MICVICGAEFWAKTARAKYCEDNCKSEAYRRRHGLDGPVGRPPNNRGERTARLAENREAKRNAPQSLARRIPFHHQLLTQAPAAAGGYRLVLGVNDDAAAVLLPENPLGWRLAPFQSPDEVTLPPGRYQVIWVDAHGKQLPPENTGTVPVLDYFIGPAKAIPMDSHEAGALLRSLAASRSEVVCLKQEVAQLVATVSELRDKIRKDREFRRYKRDLREASGSLSMAEEGGDQGRIPWAAIWARLIGPLGPSQQATLQPPEHATDAVSSAEPVPLGPTPAGEPSMPAELAASPRTQSGGSGSADASPPSAQTEKVEEPRPPSDAPPALDPIPGDPNKLGSLAAEKRVLLRLRESVRQICRVRSQPVGPIEESWSIECGPDGAYKPVPSDEGWRKRLGSLLMKDSGIPPANTEGSASVQTLWKANAALASTLMVAEALLTQMHQGQHAATVTPAVRPLLVWASTTLPLLSRLREAKVRRQRAFSDHAQGALSQLEPILGREVPERDSIGGFLHDSLRIVSRLLSKAIRQEGQEIGKAKHDKVLADAAIQPMDPQALLDVRRALEMQQHMEERSRGRTALRDPSWDEVLQGMTPVQREQPTPTAMPKAQSGSGIENEALAAATLPVADPLASKLAAVPSPQDLEVGLNEVVTELRRSLRAAQKDSQLRSDPFAQSFLQGWSAIHDKGAAMLVAIRNQCSSKSLAQLERAERQELLVREVVPVFDDIYRSSHVDWSTAAPRVQGILATIADRLHSQLLDVLGWEGLEPFVPLGERFDPEQHHSVEKINEEEEESDTISSVERVGIRSGSQVIRLADVVVGGRAAA